MRASYGGSLARAASPDPFGLLYGRQKPVTPLAPQNAGALSVGNYTPYTPVRSPKPPSLPGYNANGTVGLAALPGLETAPKPQAAYDINTDPAFQQVVAYTGMSDQQAKAAAEAQRADILQAWQQEQQQMSTEHTRAVKSLDEALNKANLSYGGYRVEQEQQAAQDYQSALAKAASGVNSSLHQIDIGLAQVLAANLKARLDAAAAAAANAPVPNDQTQVPSDQPYDRGYARNH